MQSARPKWSRALSAAGLVIAVGAGCDVKTRPNADQISAAQAKPLVYPHQFVVMGDSRTPGVAVFQALLGQTAQLSPAPVFGLNAGDLVLTGLELEYNNYIDSLAAVPYPFISGIGNHEQYAPDGANLYQTAFGPEDFYFDYGPSRFIYLDNSNPDAYGLTSAQLAWLESVLDDPTHPDKYTFMHVPPSLPSGAIATSATQGGVIPGDDVYSPNRAGILSGIASFPGTAELINLLEAYQVRIAFFGHIHDFEHSYSNGVHYVITGGAGAEIGPVEDNPPSYGVFHHFLNVKIAADGHSHVDVIKYGNGVVPSPEYGFDFSTTPVP